MAAQPILRTVLEVERKFARLKVYPLHLSGGCPPFKSLHQLPSKTFRDIYYDFNDRLSRAGTWVRQRDGRWESKIRQAGDYNDSQFKEIQDYDLIRKQVASLTSVSKSASEAFGLRQMADIATLRESWLADDRFKVVLDQTDFGHVVGEVEIEMEIDAAESLDIREVGARMDQDIVDFMQRYAWAFDITQPIGKLTAYFARRAAQRYLFPARLRL